MYCVVNLCFKDPSYVAGAIIQSKIHKDLLKTRKDGKDIEIVLLCDEEIYKYKDLMVFYDKVIKIDLKNYKLSKKYRYYKEKYEEMMPFLLNKWQILNLDYKMVMFLDLDMIPKTPKLYDLFYQNKDMFYCSSKIHKIDDISLEKFLSMQKSINASMMLLKPDKKLYKEMVKTYREMGTLTSTMQSGVDETFFAYVYSKHKTIIPFEEDVVGFAWSKNSDRLMVHNYQSYYLPWCLPEFLSWDEQMIWHNTMKEILESKLDDKVLDGIGKLYKFYINEMYETFKKDTPFNKKNRYNYLKYEYEKKKKLYNEEI